jgi:hypothetical protein
MSLALYPSRVRSNDVLGGAPLLTRPFICELTRISNVASDIRSISNHWLKVNLEPKQGRKLRRPNGPDLSLEFFRRLVGWQAVDFKSNVEVAVWPVCTACATPEDPEAPNAWPLLGPSTQIGETICYLRVNRH